MEEVAICRVLEKAGCNNRWDSLPYTRASRPTRAHL